MIYPTLVLSLVVIIGLGLVWFLLPRLAVIFVQLDVALPPLTRGLMALGRFFQSYGVIAVPGFVALLIFLIFFLFVNHKTRFIGQSFLFNLPVIKNLIQQREISRFGYVLGTLLEAGIPIINALQSLHRVTTFTVYRDFYIYLAKSIYEGNSFQGSFKSYKMINKLIPIPIQQMILSGERSGKLSFVLLKTGEIFENKLETTSKNLTVLLEPIMLIIVWIGVLLLALAIVMPIYSLIGNIN
jgi:type II secretory pathway component PulF